VRKIQSGPFTVQRSEDGAISIRAAGVNLNLISDEAVALADGVMAAIRNGYTHHEYREAFNRVLTEGQNWKMPIDKVVEMDATEIPLIRQAIIDHTASTPSFTSVGVGRYRVRAAGYYATVGA
jgi:hypothetical protein